MFDLEYNKLISLAKRYIQCGRDYYSNITAEDLVSEAIIYIADNGIEVITLDVFWVILIKVRSKMVNEILRQNPKLHALHIFAVRKYYKENKNKINIRRRNAYRIAKEKLGHSVSNAGARIGKEHYKFKGHYHTPGGIFESSYSAASSLGISHRCVQYRCKNEKFKDWYIA